MEGHFLEKYKTHNKPEAKEAYKRVKSRGHVNDVTNERHERIQAYLKRLEDVFLITDQEGTDKVKMKKRKKRNIELLKPEIYKRTIIQPENFPDEYYQYQKQLMKECGFGDVNFSEEEKRQEIVNVQNKQMASLDAWIDHLSSDESHYPTDIKYFAMQGILRTGAFDQTHYRFGSRVESSTASFPQIDHEALSMVMGALEAVHHAGDTDAYTDVLLDLIKRNKDFGSMYAEAMRYLDTEGGKDKSLEITEGAWRIFQKGSNPQELVESFSGKRAYLCLGNIGDASGYLKQGDMHVYFSNNRAGIAVWPRIAIATDSERGAYELRGTYNKNEDIDPEISKTNIVKEHLATIPNGESFAKKDADMRLLTTFERKQKKEEPLTKDDLRFLYEVDSTIEGFGYDRDPRIKELIETRDRKADIATIADCSPEHIITSFTELSQNTEVYVEDTGTTLRFCDFREAPQKLKELLKLKEKLIEVGSPAVPDLSFEGGIVNINFTPEMVRDRDTAFNNFDNADGHSPNYIWPEWWKGIETWKPPEGQTLAIVVLSYNNDPKIRQSSEKIVADMDRLGLRPLTREEMTLAGIMEPKFTKTPNKYFIGLTQYAREGYSFVPGLWQDGGERGLDGDRWGSAWDGDNRFLCVRK